MSDVFHAVYPILIFSLNVYSALSVVAHSGGRSRAKDIGFVVGELSQGASIAIADVAGLMPTT